MNKNFILKLNKLNNVKQNKIILERLNVLVKPRNEHTIIEIEIMYITDKLSY